MVKDTTPSRLSCSLLKAWLNVTSTCRNCHHQSVVRQCCHHDNNSCRANFADVAETEGMHISLHPDDPPWGLLGIVTITIIILIISVKSSRLLHLTISMATASIISNIIMFTLYLGRTSPAASMVVVIITFSCRSSNGSLDAGRLSGALQKPPLPKVV